MTTEARRAVPAMVPTRPTTAPAIQGGPAMPVAAYSDPDNGDGLDWRRMWYAIARFKYLILAVTLVGAALGIVATRFLVGGEYVAQATIWIDQTDNQRAAQGPARGPIQSSHLLDPQAWIDLLRSYEVLDQVVRDQRLYLSVRPRSEAAVLAGFALAREYQPGEYRLTFDSTGQHYTLSSEDGAPLETGAVGDSVGRRLGFVWAPASDVLGAGKTVHFSVAAVRDGARVLGDQLEVQMVEDGSFLRVGLRGNDPAGITAIMNAVVQRYVQVAADLKRLKVSELTKILNQQLESARQRLAQTESSVERFGVQTITLPGDRGSAMPAAGGARPEGTAAAATYFDLQFEHEGLRRDREALERVAARASRGGLSASEIDAIPSVQKSRDLTETVKELITKQAELRALKYRYSDAYPPVQRLTTDIATLEQQTIPRLARTLAGELATRERDLGRRLDADSRTLRQIPPRAIEEGRRRRAMTLAENLYTTLQQRYEEARLAEVSTIPDVRILDAAVTPRRPVKDTAPRIILFATLASLGLALVGAVVLDRADPRVRYPEQVSRDMGLTILGTIPHLRHAAKLTGAHSAPANASEVVEALRGVCLNLSHAYGTAGPIVIAVTSPGAGDGKSFVAANVAHTFADSGLRVLLVDSDIRRGVQHRRFGRPRRPGLSDYLRGEVAFETVVQSTAHPSLSFIACGVRASDAPQLLGSPAMASLGARLRTSYDVVIFDTPPLAAGIDPLILGTLTGHLLLVLRNGHSNREMMAAKLQVVQRLPLRVLGAILNDVPDGTLYGFYSYYLPGYEGVEEERAESVVI